MKEIPLGFVAGTVIKRIDWAEHLFSLHVHAPASAFPSPPFTAGQFSKLAVRNENDEWVRRAYSMVNKPCIEGDDAVFEFLVIEIPDGKLTPLLGDLKPGDDVLVGTLPAGFMTLDEVPDTTKDLWMLSTGTGIGPFISILEEVEQCQRFDHLVLVHAVRTQEELVYKDKIIDLMKAYKGKLRYVPIVSRESVSGALSGRIPQQLQTGGLATAAHVPLTEQNSFFYLCGNPNMVHDTRDALQQMGYKKHLRREAGHFSFENYW
ncbi:ferredoxin--NADP reductase [Vibrio rumoiensis]|uniref:ferredoxin--NADP(+) reductase n=1 Tax=Vibrio rumoiensis 1S-45 TaxID=1188252 RepID=A0A1E5E2U3_9VIBR|nr:ferredoxin--NADP reductase [Vibrio rumoiensis]OEF25519.1 ferredoxin--NADP(+) reductase [Vibrio rumoiensis 1S-45]